MDDEQNSDTSYPQLNRSLPPWVTESKAFFKVLIDDITCGWPH